jgi:hypothetical protein
MAEKFSKEWLEEMHYDWELVDEMIAFFNAYYKMTEHPLDRKTAFLLGDYTDENSHLAILIDSLMWKAINPHSQEEINYFYRITPFELMVNWFKAMGNSTESICEYLEKKLKGHSYKTILNYGGGSGWISVWLAKRGYEVTHTEINLPSLEWMKYISKKLNLNIKVIDLMKETIEPMYDMILVKDVFEHLKDPQKLYEFLLPRSNCLIYEPDNVEGPLDTEPMHFKFKGVNPPDGVVSSKDEFWK